MKLYPVGLVGESNYQPAVQRTCPGEVARICHERGNPYDDLALRVENAAGEVIGYIATSSWLRSAIHHEGRGVAATVKFVTASPDGPDLGVVLDVTLTDDDVLIRQYAAQPDDGRRRPPRKPQRSGGPTLEPHLATLIGASVFPVTCDCGAVYRVSLAGLTLETVLDCPSCKAPNTLDGPTLERLREEFLSAARQLLAGAEIEFPGDQLLLDKLTSAPRPPTELIAPRRAPKPGQWRRWFP